MTLKDIAQACGLSVSAVSQALRRQPAIPVATQERVRAEAERLGYRPDPALAALNHYRHRRTAAERGVVLAYVTAFPTRAGWKKTPFLRRTFAGAQMRAEALGYRLEPFWLKEPGMSAERFCDVLEARGIRGLLIAPLPEPAGGLELRWAAFSAVAIGPSLVQPALHSACNNHYQSMLVALETLYGRGYRRIGLVLDPSVDERHQQKYQAAFSIWRRPGTESLPPLLTTALTDQALKAWLGTAEPDVVLAHDAEVMAALVRLGRRVPEDVGFATLIRGAERTVAGIETAPEQIAAHAVDRLASLLHQAESGVPALPTCTMLNGVWVDGSTVRTLSG